jgi:hypothetical protein
MERFLEKNDLIMWANALLESLAWGEENSKKFESRCLSWVSSWASDPSGPNKTPAAVPITSGHWALCNTL